MMVITTTVREKWLPGLYHLPRARCNTKNSHVLSHLKLPVPLGGRFSFYLCFANKGTERGSQSLRNLQDHTVRKWQSQDPEQCLPPRALGSGQSARPAVAEPGVRARGDLHVCEHRDGRSEQPTPETRWIHSKHSITSVYLLLLFTALFPK